MERKREYIYVITIFFLVSLVTFLFIQNKRIFKLLPYPQIGQKIVYFEVFSKKGDFISKDALQKKKTILFIFSQPCSACEKNILFWNKIAEKLKKDTQVLGLILNQKEDNIDEKILNFPIYYPSELADFIHYFPLKTNLSLTIVYDKKISFLKIGALGTEDVQKILRSEL